MLEWDSHRFTTLRGKKDNSAGQHQSPSKGTLHCVLSQSKTVYSLTRYLSWASFLTSRLSSSFGLVSYRRQVLGASVSSHVWRLMWLPPLGSQKRQNLCDRHLAERSANLPPRHHSKRVFKRPKNHSLRHLRRPVAGRRKDNCFVLVFLLYFVKDCCFTTARFGLESQSWLWQSSPQRRRFVNAPMLHPTCFGLQAPQQTKGAEDRIKK